MLLSACSLRSGRSGPRSPSKVPNFSSLILTGFGLRSFMAPEPASTAAPMMPPTSTLPAIPAPPAPDICDTTLTFAGSYPAFFTSTTISLFRGNLKVAGVTPVIPFESFTSAPAGWLFTTNVSLVPRVIVAHAESMTTTPIPATALSAPIFMFIAPPVISVWSDKNTRPKRSIRNTNWFHCDAAHIP